MCVLEKQCRRGATLAGQIYWPAGCFEGGWREATDPTAGEAPWARGQGGGASGAPLEEPVIMYVDLSLTLSVSLALSVSESLSLSLPL
jgi:hypothetical protein